MRDDWERTSYAGPWKPVPYEEEEVEQQLSRNYMQEHYEDLNEPELDMGDSDEERRQQELLEAEEHEKSVKENKEDLRKEDSEEEAEYDSGYGVAEKKSRLRRLWMLNKFSV